MTNRAALHSPHLDFEADRIHVLSLARSEPRDPRGNRVRGAVDDALRAMHVKYHDRPREHVGVHATWMKIEFDRGAYHRAAFHAFAGYVVAGPASLVQRYTGLVVPAFDAKK